MFSKKDKKELYDYIDSKVKDIKEYGNIKLRDPSKDNIMYDKTVYLSELIKDLYREVFEQRSDSVSGGLYVPLSEKLRQYLKHSLDDRDKKIQDLSKELVKLKRIVAEVTDFVYKEEIK